MQFEDPSGLQNPASVRNLFMARQLSRRIVGEDGRIDDANLKGAIHELRQNLYSLEIRGHLDTPHTVHMLRILMRLERPRLRRALMRISEPVDNPLGSDLIRQTLEIEGLVTTKDARRAALSALLTLLRQNVGSCFATAPAIQIQDEDPARLLSDLDELLSMGRLTRGDFQAPLSPSWGLGDLLRPVKATKKLRQSPGLQRALDSVEEIPTDGRMTTAQEIIGALGGNALLFKSLTDNALLKAWEFTIASFADVQSRGNLFETLGLRSEQEGGLGAVIVEKVEGYLASLNQNVEQLQRRYEVAFTQAKIAESRARRDEWEGVDLQRKVAEMDALLQERDLYHQRAQKMAGLYSWIVENYLERFGDFFQEVYDPEMVEVVSLYDDSPAGFRLIYKHGRSAVSAWSLIRSEDEFIDALVDFVSAMERELEFEGPELSELTSAIIAHLRSPVFLESALNRFGSRRPWAYISGGTMRHLVANYYGKELPTLTERQIESPTDLFVFLLEAMKEMPDNESQGFLEDPTRSLLIQSPTHGFLFKPGLAPFRDGWLDRGNTYTWVRDQIIEPQRDFWSQFWLTREMMAELVKSLGLKLKYPLKRQRIWQFRDFLTKQVGHEELIDSYLYQHLPFVDGGVVDAVMERIVPGASGGLHGQQINVKRLYIECLKLSQKRFGSSVGGDLSWKIRQSMPHPKPVIFADTNWPQSCFGFLVNPGTRELELWRTDYLGLEASPMSSWKLDGSETQPWGLYPLT